MELRMQLEEQKITLRCLIPGFVLIVKFNKY